MNWFVIFATLGGVSFIPGLSGAEKMALQSGKMCLLCKPGDPSPIPGTHVKMEGEDPLAKCPLPCTWHLYPPFKKGDFLKRDSVVIYFVRGRTFLKTSHCFLDYTNKIHFHTLFLYNHSSSYMRIWFKCAKMKWKNMLFIFFLKNGWMILYTEAHVSGLTYGKKPSFEQQCEVQHMAQ